MTSVRTADLAAELRRIGVTDVGRESIALGRPAGGAGFVRFGDQADNRWEGPVPDARDRLAMIEEGAGPDAFWRAFPEFLPASRLRGVARPPHLGLSLGRLICLYLLVWLVDGIASIGPLFGPGCTGGGYGRADVGAAIGGVLLVTAAVALERLPRSRGLLVAAFATGYPVALLLFWYGIAPAIWGSTHCT